MKLRNLALVLCASSALFAACSDNDSGGPAIGDAGAGGSGNAGTSGKAGTAGNAGKAGAAGAAGAAGMADTAGAAGMADTAGAAGIGGAGGEAGASTVRSFTVTLENVAPAKAFTSSGVFDTPVGDLTVGRATADKTYTFTVDAGRKQKLSFATMLAETNDLFFAPNGDGIALYHSDDGTPIGSLAAPADVTSQVFLWDAGTEANEEPFIGPNTGTQETAPNMGPVDPNNKVRKVIGNSDGVHAYPAVNTLIQVTVAHTTGTLFVVTITVLHKPMLGPNSDLVDQPASLSPGVWVLSSAANPLFTDQAPAPALGLEALAEDGKPATLGAYAATTSGITYPASQGAWLIHTTGTKPLFTAGSPDYKKGIEAIAEDGNATPLGLNLPSLDGYITGAVFNTPVGAASPGPILPGSKYQFTFDAKPGDSLSFATMLAATNDVFLSPGASGIPLFATDGTPVTGDVSSLVSLWDAGTEGNEEPGIGPNTVTNQLAPNTGTPGEGKVQLLSAVTTDTYSYPSAQAVLHVTLATN